MLLEYLPGCHKGWLPRLHPVGSWGPGSYFALERRLASRPRLWGKSEDAEHGRSSFTARFYPVTVATVDL